MNRILFLFILVVFHTTVKASDFSIKFGLPQGVNEISTTYGNSISPVIQFTYDITPSTGCTTPDVSVANKTYDPVTIKVYFPSGVFYGLSKNTTISQNKDLTGAEIVNYIPSEEKGGKFYQVLEIKFNKLEKTIGTSTSITLGNISTPNSGCNNGDIELIAVLKTTCDDTKEAKVKVSITDVDVLSADAFQVKTEYCSTEKSPLKYLVRLTKGSGSYYNDYNVNLQLSYSASDNIKCIGATIVDQNYNNPFNIERITPSTNTSTKVVAENISFPDYGDKWIMFYFDAPTSDKDINVTVKADFYRKCNPVNLQKSSSPISKTYQGVIQTEDCDDASIVQVPDVLLRNWAACFGTLCQSTLSFETQLDNSFDVPAKVDYTGPLTYEMIVGNSIDISTFYVNNLAGFPLANNVLMYYKVGTGDYMQYSGAVAAGAPFNKSILSLSSGDRISQLKFVFPSYESLFSTRFNFQYSFKVDSETPTAQVGITSNVIYGGNTIKTKTSYLALQGTGSLSCQNYTLSDYVLDEQAGKYIFTTYGTDLPLDEENHYMALRFDYKGQPTGTSFSYRLHPSLLPFNEVGTLFLYGNTSYGQGSQITKENLLSTFKTKDQFAVGNFSGLTYQIGAPGADGYRELVFSNLNFDNNPCSGTTQSFYVLIPIKANPLTVTGTYGGYSNSKIGTTVVPYHPSLYAQWIIPAVGSLGSDLVLYCGEMMDENNNIVDGENMYGIDLKKGDKYYSRYIVDNQSNDIYSNIVLIARFPKLNDKYITENAQRGSTADLAVNTLMGAIQLKAYDENGVLVPSIDMDDFEIKYSNVSNMCLKSQITLPYDYTEASDCAVNPAWSSTIPSNASFIQIKSVTNFQLSPNYKLVFNLKGELDTTITMGNELFQSIAVSAKQRQGSLMSLARESTGVISVTDHSTCSTIITCSECIPSFSPTPGETYLLGAWVKEEVAGAITYENACISLAFKGAGVLGPIKAKGAIIDGWQRIEFVFTVPAKASDIKVQLENLGNGNVFFDDIRIHPFNSNMKSFVYDPISLRLYAELDENNYATFYEYDEEGALVRVKKETERGIKTINETRQNLSKQE